MSQLHKINHASLEFNFSGVADAEAFELRAAQWVVQQFIPVIETVFDEVCPEHQTLVIDTLTLDLGVLSTGAFYQQAPERLKQILQTTLRSQLQIARQTPQSRPPAEPHHMQVLSQQQQRWNLLWQFLRTGALPWSVAGRQLPESLGLPDMLTEHSARLINALSTASRPEQIVRRLVEQFPARHIAALFPSLAPAWQWQMMSLLLTHPVSHQGELTDRLALAWFNRFSQLLAQHNLTPLRADWEKLIQQYAPQLINALRQRHSDSQLPWCLVQDLTEAERLLLLSVLTPQEYPFLSAVLQMPDWWQFKSRVDLTSRDVYATQASGAEKSVTLLATSQIHQHLWLFTLQYLLIDRGSAFNRQSYMAGLVTRMANAQNQKAETLLASLISTLNSITLHSALREQLLHLLHAIAPVIASPTRLNASDKQEIADISLAAGAPADEAHLPIGTLPFLHINELVMALCAGKEKQLLLHWPPPSQPFAALLRWCGQLEYVRRHWCETYSDKTLSALVGILEPSATPLIQILSVQHRLFTPQHTTTISRTTTMNLWRFTFAFLIVESSGAFNPKSYLRYLIRQMARWHHVSYHHQLASLSNSVIDAGDFLLHGVPLSRLLEEIAPSGSAEKSVQDDAPSPSFFRLSLSPSLISGLSLAQLADIEQIILTLQSARLIQWNNHIKQWQRDHGKRLPLLIVSLGSSLPTIKRWVAHFDDPALFTLTSLVTPQATESVRTVITGRQTIALALSHGANPPDASNTRTALWELTLHYLISRRGSEFNHYQYLLNITEQLSARYQINVALLIHEWLRLSDSGFLWRQQLIDLVEHHQRPPVTAPQLLSSVQADDQTVAVSQQQQTLLQHYAAINASATAMQLQTWSLPQLTRLIRIMQPQCSKRLTALLPLLLAIVNQFKLAPHWFYPLLLSHDCPATPEQWLQRLLQQINRQNASPDRTLHHQLQQLVLSSNDIHHPLAERRRWTENLLPEEALPEKLQLWLEGKAPAPTQSILAGLSPRGPQLPLLQWLQRTLANPRHMQCWLEGLSAETHQAILFPRLTSTTLALLALRQAFCQLFASPKQGEVFFWQTLYRQHWLRGIAMTGDRFMQEVLIELTQLWRAHAVQDNTSDDRSVAALTERLVPLISSTSQRKTLVQIARQGKQHPPGKAPWAAHLNHQQPEIRQLAEAIDMTDKGMKKSTENTREESQDNAEVSADPIVIHNAGLVLASVYIPVLFQKLALTDGRNFVDGQAQLQALFCLQWMTDYTNSAPEYQLLLNKVLCGIAPSTAIPQQVTLPEGAETLIEGLLTAIITHWRAIGKTSISTLQASFFQREGMLTSTPEHWQLKIFPAPFDMLIDQLPWSFQTIKYPWMDLPLFVSWR
ncbi:contractile injection system tape measure protein [Erwinia papayae]|uniref:Contractile injection system tape measure protein n=1 Tax=Erwinia papayae TaxID=206499 RepID=A0ABV3MXW0_9GAMM